MRLVKVEWVDISDESKWFELSEVEKWATTKFRERMISVGFLIFQNDNFIVVAADYYPTEKMFNNLNMIPRTNVRKITTIRRV
jgi:hypothetical protein